MLLYNKSYAYLSNELCCKSSQLSLRLQLVEKRHMHVLVHTHPVPVGASERVDHADRVAVVEDV